MGRAERRAEVEGGRELIKRKEGGRENVTLTSWDILHEDLEDVPLSACSIVLDDILVLEMTMECDLFLKGLELSVGGEGGREREIEEER